MSLTKFAASLDIKDLGLTGAEVKIDPAAITFWGHSQGATEGGIAAPYMAELAGVVFSGQGASLLDALLTKTSPVDIAAALPFALSDVDPSTPSGLRGDGMHPVLSLLQMYLDPADPLNHAALIAPAALGGHHVFQVYGQKDTFSPPITEMTYAVAAQLSVAPHDSSVTTADYPQQPATAPREVGLHQRQRRRTPHRRRPAVRAPGRHRWTLRGLSKSDRAPRRRSFPRRSRERHRPHRRAVAPVTSETSDPGRIVTRRDLRPACGLTPSVLATILQGLSGNDARPVFGTQLHIVSAKRAAGYRASNTKEVRVMLWTIFVVLLVLWLLGMVSAYTLGGYIHILLVLAVVRLIQGRPVA